MYINIKHFKSPLKALFSKNQVAIGAFLNKATRNGEDFFKKIGCPPQCQ